MDTINNKVQVVLQHVYIKKLKKILKKTMKALDKVNGYIV